MSARNSDPATSHAAAAMLGFAETHRDAVLNCLLSCGEKGAEEIGELIGLDAYQVRKRLPELFAMGNVALTGNVRVTSTGRRERLWVSVEDIGIFGRITRARIQYLERHDREPGWVELGQEEYCLCRKDPAWHRCITKAPETVCGIPFVRSNLKSRLVLV